MCDRFRMVALPCGYRTGGDFVDRDGQFVINPVYRGAGDFSEDRVFVRSVDFGSYFYLTGEGSVLPYPEGINGFSAYCG